MDSTDLIHLSCCLCVVFSMAFAGGPRWMMARTDGYVRVGIELKAYQGWAFNRSNIDERVFVIILAVGVEHQESIRLHGHVKINRMQCVCTSRQIKLANGKSIKRPCYTMSKRKVAQPSSYVKSEQTEDALSRKTAPMHTICLGTQ